MIKLAAGSRIAVVWLGLLAGACDQPSTVTINRSGTHTLRGDISGRDVAVRIDADNVVLDLNGHTIRCEPPAGPVETAGVVAHDRSSVTIRRGKVTNCSFGIAAHRGNAIAIEGVDLRSNLVAGVELASGNSNVVRCSVLAANGGHPWRIYSFGINGIGQDGLIERNTFAELYRQRETGVGEGVGVVVEEGATGVLVRTTRLSTASCGRTRSEYGRQSVRRRRSATT